MTVFGTDTREVMIFSLIVPAGTSSFMFEALKAEATVEKIVCRFNAGQSRELQIRPVLKKNGNFDEDLCTYPKGGLKFVAGEDETKTLDISVPGKMYDQVYIYYNNTSTTFDYTLDVMVTVDYMGGVNRG
jgi:hypothetical protein